MAHHHQTVPNTSPEKGRGSPEPKGRGFGSGAAGARDAAWHKHSGSVPARVCVLLPEPRGLCGREAGWTGSATVPEAMGGFRCIWCPVGVSPTHSTEQLRSLSLLLTPPQPGLPLPQSLPRSLEHVLSRAHQRFPQLFPTQCSVGRDQFRHVRAGAWQRGGTRPGTGQTLSQCKVVE